MKNDAYQFWLRFDSLRKGMDIQEVAQKAQIRYRAILSMRSNQSIPKAYDCLRLAYALNVSVEHLLTGEPRNSICPEAKSVNEDKELQALVRAIQRDRRLLQVIAAVVESDEETVQSS